MESEKETESQKRARELFEHSGELAAVLTDDLAIHSFLHCRACTAGQQTPRLEAGVSRTGIVVQCKKHGIVVHFSPDQLRQFITRGPQCDCCPGGSHRS